jgi:uridine phosphorylase
MPKADEMDAIIEPRRGKSSPRLGPMAVLVAVETDLQVFRDALGFGGDPGRRLFTSRLYTASAAFPSLSLAGPMVGAPYAVMVAETLIAWGARSLVFFGWCGAVSRPVSVGDLVLPTMAFIDEGTSRHYLPEAGESLPSSSLRGQLAEACASCDIPVHAGAVWTTDAPFRETRAKVIDFQRQGALAVEMETSALFTLAAFRSAAAAALLAVSDDLSALTWKAGFKDPAFARSREAAARAIVRVCRPLEAG